LICPNTLSGSIIRLTGKCVPFFTSEFLLRLFSQTHVAIPFCITVGFFLPQSMKKEGMYLLEERSVGLCSREISSLRVYKFKISRMQQPPEGDTCPQNHNRDKRKKLLKSVTLLSQPQSYY
jgi:hypothetical protein